jgi:hypothetical protein
VEHDLDVASAVDDGGDRRDEDGRRHTRRRDHEDGVQERYAFALKLGQAQLRLAFGADERKSGDREERASPQPSPAACDADLLARDVASRSVQPTVSLRTTSSPNHPRAHAENRLEVLLQIAHVCLLLSGTPGTRSCRVVS